MMLLRNLFWFVCLVIGLVVAPAHADNVHPGLWKAQGRAGTIYLFGTVHVLPQGLQWHTPALEQAEQASSNLYLEVGNLDDQAAMLKAFNAVGYGTNLPDIVDRVRPAKRAALAALLAKYHVNAAGLKPFKTWAVVISLSGLVLKDGQYDAENGVEHGLANDFNVAHKPVNGLETISEQLSYLDSVSLGGQEKFFESFIDDAAKSNAQTAEMIRAWEQGKTEKIARAFDRDERSDPELTRILLHNRNVRWANWVAAQLDRPGVTFMAVGAGHLAGRDSVIAMLRAKGVRVTRIQ